MSQFRLMWVGRPRSQSPESLLADRYLDRLKRFISFDQHVIKPSGPSASTGITMQKESNRMLETLKDQDFVVLLDERGNQLSSEGLAKFVARHQQAGRRMIWLIGGAMGVSSALRQRADFVLSLSKMTLPHAFARAFLLEQIYRAMCINANHPYHHEG